MKLLDGKRILIVDDEPLLREILADELESQGAIILTASCGNDAVEWVKYHHIDAVLSDVRMPNGDGVSLIKKINLELKSKPLVFLFSGFNDISEKEIRSLGVIEFFPKPFQAEKIINSIANALNSPLKAAA